VLELGVPTGKFIQKISTGQKGKQEDSKSFYMVSPEWQAAEHILYEGVLLVHTQCAKAARCTSLFLFRISQYKIFINTLDQCSGLVYAI
jgi:hypothetical protein